MGKWKTRTDGSEAQIGKKYEERDAAYPYGTTFNSLCWDFPVASATNFTRFSTLALTFNSLCWDFPVASGYVGKQPALKTLTSITKKQYCRHGPNHFIIPSRSLSRFDFRCHTEVVVFCSMSSASMYLPMCKTSLGSVIWFHPLRVAGLPGTSALSPDRYC